MVSDFKTEWENVKNTAYKLCHNYHIHGYDFEDLMQEAMTEFWKTYNLYEDGKGAKLNTFYYLRLRNRFTSILQKVSAKKNFYNVAKHASLDDEGIELFLSSDYPNPEQNALRMESLEKVIRFLDKLTPKYQDTVRYLVEGMSRKDIAEQLGVNYNTITRRINDLQDIINGVETKRTIKALKSYVPKKKRKRKVT